MIKRINVGIICLIMLGCDVVVVLMIIFSCMFYDSPHKNAFVTKILKGVSIQSTFKSDEWVVKYPYSDNSKDIMIDRINQTKKVLNSFCTISFPKGNMINNVVMYGKSIVKYNPSAITDEHDDIQFVTKGVENVLEFQKKLSKCEIPFLYIQTPSSEIIEYYKNDELMKETSTIIERRKAFIGALNKSGVNMIDLASSFPGEISFDCTDHWMPTDALQCAYIVADYLNNIYAFDIDLRVYEKEKFSDCMLEQYELRNSISDIYGYEFSVLLPDYPTTFTLVYAEQEEWKGSFKDALLNSHTEWTRDKVPYHNVFRVNNSLIYKFTNNLASCNRSILIIGDSFDWPVATYLSLGVRELTVIHNASFNGSIVSYINSVKPDAVMIIYNDAEFHETYFEEAYDFR